MQAKHHDGTYGPVMPFDTKELEKQLTNPNVKHVEVFEATAENIKNRQKFLGIKKRYQKKPKNKNIQDYEAV